MKLKNVVCKDMKSCCKCPYSKPQYLKVCTNFKLAEPLAQGLENSKGILSKQSIEKLTKELNEEAK